MARAALFSCPLKEKQHAGISRIFLRGVANVGNHLAAEDAAEVPNEHKQGGLIAEFLA